MSQRADNFPAMHASLFAIRTSRSFQRVALIQGKHALHTHILGLSGRRYVVEGILQDEPGNQGRVSLATLVVPIQMHTHLQTIY